MPKHVHNEKCIVIEGGHSHPDVDDIPMPKMTAAQLHRYVEYYNWDGPLAPMWRAIRHPKCDLGTALMIFWLCDPEFSYELLQRGEKIEKYMVGGIKLMRSVQARVCRGQFKRAQISFNPRPFMMTAGKCSQLGIPGYMCQPVVKGRKDPRLGGITARTGTSQNRLDRSTASKRKLRGIT